MTHISTQSGQQLQPGSHATKELPANNYHGQRLLKRAALLEKLGISRSTLYRLTKPGGKEYDPTFPIGMSLNAGPNSAKVWLEADADAWMYSKLGKTI